MPPVDASVLEAGDVLWIDFGAPFGHEQAGRCPALVISPQHYNRSSSLIVVCPISRNPRAWPFKVEIPPVGTLTGAVMVDQLRAIDPAVRVFARFGHVPTDVLIEVRAKIASLFGIPVSS